MDGGGREITALLDRRPRRAPRSRVWHVRSWRVGRGLAGGRTGRLTRLVLTVNLVHRPPLPRPVAVRLPQNAGGRPAAANT